MEAFGNDTWASRQNRHSRERIVIPERDRHSRESGNPEGVDLKSLDSRWGHSGMTHEQADRIVIPAKESSFQRETVIPAKAGIQKVLT